MLTWIRPLQGGVIGRAQCTAAMAALVHAQVRGVAEEESKGRKEGEDKIRIERV